MLLDIGSNDFSLDIYQLEANTQKEKLFLLLSDLLVKTTQNEDINKSKFTHSLPVLRCQPMQFLGLNSFHLFIFRLTLLLNKVTL